MRSLPILIGLLLLNCASLAEERPEDDSRALRETQAVVARIMSYPGYTEQDRQMLNSAGDLAAVAVIRTIGIEDLKSIERIRPILLVLTLSFENPQFIVTEADRKPTAALLLLSYLEQTGFPVQHPNELENTRRTILHNTATGKPSEFVMLPGQPPVDHEHTQRIDSILQWTLAIRPGMRRRDLLRVYTTEGGISTRKERRHALKQCPYIKVDVEFSPVGEVEALPEENPDDKIVKVSKPFLEYGIAN